MTTHLRVTRLRTYPVKSMAGNDVESATVEPWGLAGDRRWGLVDGAGKNVTARMVHSLLGLRAEPLGSSNIRIVDVDGTSITVNAPVGASTTPVDFDGLARATPANEAANAWISERIRHPLRLDWQEDPTLRPISVNHGGQPGDSLSLADDGPLLLATEASLRQLNDWIAAEHDAGAGTAGNDTDALDIVRFRPNVIVDGHQPFAEDNWDTVHIGDVTFRKTVLCDRCVMTTIEPTTLAGGKEPIRTLARHRRWDGKTWFGIRLAPIGIEAGSSATISVGDAVEVELD